MRLFNKAAIIGTGLIGGSLALEIRKKGLAKEVVGVSRHKESLSWAKRIGAIDKGSQNLNIIRGADLVILATPVNSILGLAGPISRIIAKNCLVTDVGSTKERIVRAFENLFPNYVGSHPLAGSEKRGVKNARKDLFKGSLCILTPTKKTNAAALRKINLLWKNAGAMTFFLTPQAHDRILSSVSHLPHVVAFSLIEAVPESFLKFSSGGLKDSTRIASSDSELWAQIFLSNSGNIVRDIGLFQKKLNSIKLAIRSKNKKKLSTLLQRAKDKRNRLP
jgi:prephenate dehydrogenase